MKGEKLFDFLERQVGDQMATVLNQPMHNIPENILSRVVSKSIQADLRKYKMGARAERTVRDRTRSPVKVVAAPEPYEPMLSQGRNRSSSANRGNFPPSNAEVARYELQLNELRRNLSERDAENDKLRRTMQEMVEEYLDAVEHLQKLMPG